MFKRHPYLLQCLILIVLAVCASYFTNKLHLERRFTIINFFVLLSGFIFPINYAVGCGLIIPVICSVLYQAPEVYPQLLLTLCLMTAYTSFANIFYFSAKWNIYKALIASLIMGELVLFSTASILSWITDGFSAISYMIQSFIETLPGFVLQIAIIPLILKIYEYFHNKTKIMLPD